MSDLSGSINMVMVRVLPADFKIAVPTGTVLMAAAQAVGIRWPSACNGQAQCGLCAVEVVAGEAGLAPPLPREAQMLERLIHRPRHGGVMRLACQLLPGEPMTVARLGVRAPAADVPRRCS